MLSAGHQQRLFEIFCRECTHNPEDVLAYASCDICTRSIAIDILNLRTTPDPYAFDTSEPMSASLWAMCVCRMLSSLASSALLLPPHTLGNTMPLFLPVLSSPMSVSLQTIDQQALLHFAHDCVAHANGTQPSAAPGYSTPRYTAKALPPAFTHLPENSNTTASALPDLPSVAPLHASGALPWWFAVAAIVRVRALAVMLQVGFAQPCAHGTHATLTACHPSATLILQFRSSLAEWLQAHAQAIYAAQAPLVDSLQSDAPSLGWHAVVKPLLSQWRVAPGTDVLLALARTALPLPSLAMWVFVAAEVHCIDRWLLPGPHEASPTPTLPSSLPTPFDGDTAAAAVLAAVLHAQGGVARAAINPQQVVAVIDNHCYPLADAAVQVWTACSNALARLSRCSAPAWTDTLVAPAFSRYSPLVLPALLPRWRHYYASASALVPTPSSSGSPWLASLTPRPAAKSHFPPPSPSSRHPDTPSLLSDTLPITPALSAFSLHSSSSASPSLAPISEDAPLPRAPPQLPPLAVDVDGDVLPRSPPHAPVYTPRRASHPPSTRAFTPRAHAYAEYTHAMSLAALKLPMCPTPTNKPVLSPLQSDTCHLTE